MSRLTECREPLEGKENSVLLTLEKGHYYGEASPKWVIFLMPQIQGGFWYRSRNLSDTRKSLWHKIPEGLSWIHSMGTTEDGLTIKRPWLKCKINLVLLGEMWYEGAWRKLVEDYIMVQIFTVHPIGRAIHHLYKVENFRILFISGDYKEIGWLNIN